MLQKSLLKLFGPTQSVFQLTNVSIEVSVVSFPIAIDILQDSVVGYLSFKADEVI